MKEEYEPLNAHDYGIKLVNEKKGNDKKWTAVRTPKTFLYVSKNVPFVARITNLERFIEDSLKYEKEYQDYANRTIKALNYINDVWIHTSMPTNTIVALRTLENILKGSDKE